jgi:DNA-binding transcriptional LysR family regulator
VDIKRLTHVIALADERNFGRAAARVHLSQPAFSRSVQAIENNLGMQLFERGGAEVTLTAAGAFVVERARKLVSESRFVQRDINLYRDRMLGNVSIGFAPAAAAVWLPRLSAEMRKQFPKSNCKFEIGHGAKLLDMLRAGDLELFVAHIGTAVDRSDLSCVHVFSRRAGFFVRAGHPLVARGPVPPSEMLGFGIASSSMAEGVRTLLLRALGLDESAQFSLVLECDDLNLLKQTALESDTVLTLTDDVVRQEIHAGKLVPLKLHPDPDLRGDVELVSIKGHLLSPVARHAASVIESLARAGLVAGTETV